MVANAVRRIALGELTASGRFYADLDELIADGRQAPLRPRRRPRRARRRRRRGCRRRRRARRRRGDPLHRRVRDARRRRAATCSRGASRRAPTSSARGSTRALVAAGLPQPRRAARARRRAGGGEIGARALGFEPVGGRRADGPAWELALRARRRTPATRRPSRSCGGAAATGARAPRGRSRTPSSRGSPRHGAPLDARVSRATRSRARRRPGRARPRALPLAPAAARPDRRAALHGGRGAGLARRHRRRVARARRRRPRGDGRPAHRRRHGPARRSWTAAGAWATLARDAFAASAGAIVLRARGVEPRPRSSTPARGLMRLWLEATRRELAIHPWGSPFLFQRLLEDGDSLEGWERSALTGAAARVRARRRARPRPPGPAHPARVARRPAVGAVAAAAGRRRARLRGVRLSTPRGPAELADPVARGGDDVPRPEEALAVDLARPDVRGQGVERVAVVDELRAVVGAARRRQLGRRDARAPRSASRTPWRAATPVRSAGCRRSSSRGPSRTGRACGPSRRRGCGRASTGRRAPRAVAAARGAALGAAWVDERDRTTATTTAAATATTAMAAAVRRPTGESDLPPRERRGSTAP